MPFYAYPIYTPEVVYSTPYAVQPFLMAHERQIHNMLQVEATRQQYLAHVEEQRMLAEQVRRREALQREAEYRQREIVAALHRRNSFRLNNSSPSHTRRRAFARPERSAFIVIQEEPKVEDFLGFDLAKLVGFQEEADYAETEGNRLLRAAHEEARKVAAAEEAKKKAFEQARRAAIMERARRAQATAAAEKAKKIAAAKAREANETDRLRRAAIYNARVRFLTQLQALQDESQQSATPSPQESFKAAESVKVPIESPASSPTRIPTPASESPKPSISDAELTSRDGAARSIQRRWRSRSADKAAFEGALATITLLRDRFEFLKHTFNPPNHLEFRADDTSVPQSPSPGPSDVSERLLYTPSNISIHTYTNELTKLLMLADGVPSAGNKKIREVRKSLVKMIESALEEVEKMVADIWERQSAQEASRPTTPDAASETRAEVDAEFVQEAQADASQTSEAKSDVTVQPTSVTIEVAFEPGLDVVTEATSDIAVAVAVDPRVEDTSILSKIASFEPAISVPTDVETTEESSAIDVPRLPEPVNVLIVEGSVDASRTFAEDEKGIETASKEVSILEEARSLSVVDQESSQDVASIPTEQLDSPLSNDTASYSHAAEESQPRFSALTPEPQHTEHTDRPESPISEGYNVVYPDSPSQDAKFVASDPVPLSEGFSGGFNVGEEKLSEQTNNSAVTTITEEEAADEEEDYDIV